VKFPERQPNGARLLGGAIFLHSGMAIHSLLGPVTAEELDSIVSRALAHDR
jgi:hypothetical protein